MIVTIIKLLLLVHDAQAGSAWWFETPLAVKHPEVWKVEVELNSLTGHSSILEKEKKRLRC